MCLRRQIKRKKPEENRAGGNKGMWHKDNQEETARDAGRQRQRAGREINPSEPVLYYPEAGELQGTVVVFLSHTHTQLILTLH